MNPVITEMARANIIIFATPLKVYLLHNVSSLLLKKIANIKDTIAKNNSIKEILFMYGPNL